MKFRLVVLLLLATGLVAMVSSAWAQDVCQTVSGNLIVNCGFETGDFTGWTQTGNLGNTTVTTSAAFSGNFGAQLGPVGSDGFLTQSFLGNTFTFAFRQGPSFWDLDTVVVTPFVSCGTNCETFALSFWLTNLGGPPNDFTVIWNGVDVGPSLVDAGTFPYTLFSGFVDGTNSTIPEPSSLVLMGTGLLGVVGVVRRKMLR